MASLSPKNAQRLAELHRRSPSGDQKQFKEFRERTRQDSQVSGKIPIYQVSGTGQDSQVSGTEQDSQVSGTGLDSQVGGNRYRFSVLPSLPVSAER